MAPPDLPHSHRVVRKGRGSGSNDQSRYIAARSEAVDDGWSSTGTGAGAGIETEDESWQIATQFFRDRTRSIITKNQSPDIGFSQSINPYKGCEHGCIYCFARPTHAYLDLSPGLDFETKIFYKTDVREHLLAELSHAKYQCSPLAIGTNTDPYQPAEKRRRIMREVLETLLECQHPVSIVTKSALVTRDIDLLAELAAQGLTYVHVSVTTLDNTLKTKLEPRTASPQARLRTITELRAAGIPTGAMLAPIIPFVNDREIEALVSACAEAGAQALGYILIRLPLEVQPLFEEWLANHYPLKAERVMAAIRDTRGGRAYRAEWHKRMVGEGQIAQLIQQRFNKAVTRAGLPQAEFAELRTDLFQRPSHPQDAQLKLF